MRRNAKGDSTMNNGEVPSGSMPTPGEPLPTLPSVYSIHDFHMYGIHATGITPGKIINFLYKQCIHYFNPFQVTRLYIGASKLGQFSSRAIICLVFIFVYSHSSSNYF